MNDPRPARAVGHRANAVLVTTAFATGVLLSLAIRPASRTVEGNGAKAEQRSTRWRAPSAFPTALPILGEHMHRVSAQIRNATHGRLNVEVFDPGKLVPAFGITPAVRDGKVEAGFTSLIYDMGRIPASPLLAAVPFGMEPGAFAAWWYEGGGQQLAETTYAAHGVHPVLCGLIGPETAGWFRRAVRSTEDFVGLKIRFSGLGGRVLQALGASVTVLPAGEIYPALEKGAIDATEFSLPEIDQRIGFHRIVRYNLFPGWHQTFSAFHLLVNRARWAELDDSARTGVEMACTAGVTRMLARAEATQGAFIERFRASGGTAMRLPAPLLAELRATTTRVLETEAANDDRFARVLASQRAFSAQYRTWRHLGYLTPQERAP